MYIPLFPGQRLPDQDDCKQGPRLAGQSVRGQPETTDHLQTGVQRTPPAKGSWHINSLCQGYSFKALTLSH